MTEGGATLSAAAAANRVNFPAKNTEPNNRGMTCEPLITIRRAERAAAAARRRDDLAKSLPLPILHVDFTLRLIIKSIWPPSLGSVLSVADPRTGSEGRNGANQPREEFLLFIASILGAAARETENSNGDGRRGRRRRNPIPKAATDLQSIYRTKLFTR